MTEVLGNNIKRNDIACSFSKAAKLYETHAVLQREIANRLIEKLDYINCDPEVVVDAGCGTGYCSRLLAERFPKAEVTGFDLAEGMIEYAKNQQGWLTRLLKKQKFIQADMCSLPLEDNSVDFLFSNLAIQWIMDLDVCFQEWQRVLKPGGLLLFSSFGPDTLFELRQSWQKVDTGIHVNQFLDMHDIGDGLINNHLSQPVMDAENITTTYQDVKQLMRELKAIGAHNISKERQKGLTGKKAFETMFDAYEKFRTEEGWIPATWEVVYGHAWGTDYNGPKMTDAQTFVIEPGLKINRV